MLVVTPQQMREIDQRAIKKYRITDLALMENAGKCLADQAEEMMDTGWLEDRANICIICGKGNNGGDGLVAARLLAEKGYEISVYLLGRQVEIKGDAKTSLNRLRADGHKITEILAAKDVNHLKKAITGSRLILDAIFGTGFKGRAEKIPAMVIEAINASEVPVLSADIPSGIDGETGQADGPAVRAEVTVTMGLIKSGLLFYPGKTMAGKVVVADIGFPERAITEQKIKSRLIEKAFARGLLPDRRPDAYKGSCGTVLTLAGSAGMTGAAVLTSSSAMRSGAGLVYLGIAESLNDIIESKLTEVITKSLPETRNRTLSLAALERIIKLLDRSDSLVVGPGLSTHPETVELVQNVIGSSKTPTVVDADGLNSFAAKPDLLAERKSLVLTPHYGELSRLLRTDISQIKAQPLKFAEEAAMKFNNIIVLKGAPSVIAAPDGSTWINTTGNSGMATAGSGDVLSGLIAGLLAQGLHAEKAAVLGVYLHGMAGDLAAESKTQYCMLAGDIVEHLPPAYRKLMEEV
jgi:NAD(P)H-hydrate epimerase